jgi:hypothetical protein
MTIPDPEPYALYLLKEYQRGKTVEGLSRETGITAERIEMRLKAAAAYIREHPWIAERLQDE